MPTEIKRTPTIKAIAFSLLSCGIGVNLAHDFKAVALNNSHSSHHGTHNDLPHDHDHGKERRRKLFEHKKKQ